VISLSFHTHFSFFLSLYILIYLILIEIPYTIIRATGLVSNTGSSSSGSDVVSSVLSNPRRLEVSQGNHWW
jgi:hypothetical protein